LSILEQLSSQVGDRSEAANRAVSGQCLENPTLLVDIVDGLGSPDPALAGDCAEVFTHVAEQRPEWAAPFALSFAALLHHKATRVRWEAAHALALCAWHTPDDMGRLLPGLAEIVRADTSIIVRDYVTDAIAEYARYNQDTARQAYPLLLDCLRMWEGRHAGHALKGLTWVAKQEPTLRSELIPIARQYLTEGKVVVRKAAKELLRVCENAG
jgi:hypothetical protein